MVKETKNPPAAAKHRPRPPPNPNSFNAIAPTGRSAFVGRSFPIECLIIGSAGLARATESDTAARCTWEADQRFLPDRRRVTRLAFITDRPYPAFIGLGAVVLTITGAEALYADLGQFGPRPIRRAWFGVVFPALTLNYLAQGALIVRNPASRANPFFMLVPGVAQIPMVVLATLATVIATVAVIEDSRRLGGAIMCVVG
jgi:hypothetical protein